MTNTETLTATLLMAATKLPLEWFVLGGSFIEEVISPIPTYAVMVTAGSVARLQHEVWWWLFVLAGLAAVGKMLASTIYYVLADLFEDVIVPRYGKYLGITHKELESIGSRFKKGAPDILFLIGLRALPVVPSVPVSIVAGLIKIPLKTFLWTGFIGTMIKDIAYLFVGYLGSRVIQDMLSETLFLERFFNIGLAVSIGLFIGWLLWRQHRD